MSVVVDFWLLSLEAISHALTNKNVVSNHDKLFRPKTVFELITDMWNSSVFNSVAPLSECHFEFQTATDCLYKLVKSLAPAAPKKIEDIFVSMRSHHLRIT